MLVVGVDLSITATGIARFAAGDGHTNIVGSTGVTGMKLPQRVWALEALAHHVVMSVLSVDSQNPDQASTPTPAVIPSLVLIEGMETSKAYGGIAERAWLWYDVARQLLAYNVPVVEVSAAQLKMYATGKGNAGKGEVIDAVARRLPMFATKGNDNLCDAAVLCAMGREHLGEPLTAMPVTHRRALEKVAWPTIDGPPRTRGGDGG